MTDSPPPSSQGDAIKPSYKSNLSQEKESLWTEIPCWGRADRVSRVTGNSEKNHGNDEWVDAIEAAIMAAGGHPTAQLLAAITEIIEAAVEDQIQAAILESWRLILHRLPRTPQFTALRRVILGNGGQTLREAATEGGFTHVALLKADKAVREALRLPRSA